jgi:5-methylcytosine-specific restriction protein B
MFEERPWSRLDADEKELVNERIRFCTFHPGLGYEDFIEGYRPAVGGQGFDLRDGIFLEACANAATASVPAALIIDELNRGNVAAVLGELITLVEADKRGKMRLNLPVSRRPFTVPENLWIIGTMNTADRSISLLDAALRRRFGFVEMMPESGRLDCAVDGLHLGSLLRLLNERIRRHVPRNARELQIGHSYFMAASRPLQTKEELHLVMRDDVIPLLAEYCFENYSALGDILGSGIVDSGAQSLHTAVMDNPDQLHLKLCELVGDAAPVDESSPGESLEEES